MTSPQQVVKHAVVRADRAESVTAYPAGLAGAPLTGASVTAGQAEKRVLITFVPPMFSPLAQIAFSLSAPLSESEPRSDLLSLTGLANKSTAGVEFRFGRHTLPAAADAGKIASGLMSLCAATRPSVTTVPGAGIAVQGCSLEELERASGTAVTEALKDFKRSALFVTAKGDVGTRSFDFADAKTLAEVSERKWTSAGAVIVGVLLPNNLYVTSGLRVERGFKAADDAAICTAVPSACRITAGGAPQPDDRNVVEAEARRFVGRHFGVSTIARWDWLNSESSLEAPIYFVRDKDGGLSGGATFGYLWSDDAKEQGPRFTVFVSQAFKLGL
jgi:hypothetical protein